VVPSQQMPGMGQTQFPGSSYPMFGNTSSDPIGDNADRDLRQQQPRTKTPAQTTEFEQMVADSVGRRLPIFGMSLFENAPTTFAPVTRAPVPADYVIGPGDEIDLRIWGQVNLNVRSSVDRQGDIYIPQVGSVNVAGVQYSKLEDRLKNEIGRIFKNFQLSASLGRLRSVQVFVVGEAAIPGQYTVSSLSTLINAIFASGGPAPNGSVRHIQLKRGSNVVTDLDLYDLLVKGDKSKDAPIQPGDVIYYPPSNGFMAVTGSVGVPAIYELAGETTLAGAITLAGGQTVLADDARVSVERIDANRTRTVVEVPLNEADRFKVQKGDIVRVLSVVPRFDNTVTLRGNVSNPGRYPFKPGMRIHDLIPNATALITREYWRNNAALVNARATEYPVKTVPNSKLDTGNNNTAEPNSDSTRKDQKNDEAASQNIDEMAQLQKFEQSPQAREELEAASVSSSIPWAAGSGRQTSVYADIRKGTPEINWDYALVQRLNPVDLKTQLIPFNLGKAILDKDPDSDIPLQSGDIVTIFSQRDISVSQVRRTKYVRIEGEVRAPGVYEIQPNETLQTIVERAGGITQAAYLFGSQLTRLSVQRQQQRSLDEFAKLIAVQMQQTTAAAANGNPEQAATIQAKGVAQQQLLASLREIRAPGRVVLELKPTANAISELPAISLEDGDTFAIPHRPAVVNVIGAVYNQGSFLFTPRRKISEYFELAGKNTPIADKGRMFVLRADGSVLTKQGNNGTWSRGFDKYRLQPGDTLVVPTKLATGVFQRNLRDWTQVVSQIALTAASLAVVAKQ
jgi:polysaccharide export outer membrane protein